MCVDVWVVKHGVDTEVRTVRQLATALGIDPANVEHDPGYGPMREEFFNACLCGVDLDATAEKAGFVCEPTAHAGEYEITRKEQQ